MLTNILLKHVFKLCGILIPLGTALGYLLLGSADALGVLAGSVLSALDGIGLIYLIGRLMDPKESSGRKWVLTAVLIAKLTLVVGLLWMALTTSGVGPLGVIIGIGLGLVATVAGASKGSSSEEGIRAIDEMSKDFEDSDSESR